MVTFCYLNIECEHEELPKTNNTNRLRFRHTSDLLITSEGEVF